MDIWVCFLLQSLNFLTFKIKEECCLQLHINSEPLLGKIVDNKAKGLGEVRMWMAESRLTVRSFVYGWDFYLSKMLGMWFP